MIFNDKCDDDESAATSNVSRIQKHFAFDRVTDKLFCSSKNRTSEVFPSLIYREFL